MYPSRVFQARAGTRRLLDLPSDEAYDIPEDSVPLGDAPASVVPVATGPAPAPATAARPTLLDLKMQKIAATQNFAMAAAQAHSQAVNAAAQAHAAAVHAAMAPFRAAAAAKVQAMAAGAQAAANFHSSMAASLSAPRGKHG